MTVRNMRVTTNASQYASVRMSNYGIMSNVVWSDNYTMYERSDWDRFTTMMRDSRERPGFIPWRDDNTPGWKGWEIV